MSLWENYLRHALLGSHRGFRDPDIHRDRRPDDPARIEAMKKRVEALWSYAIAKRRPIKPTLAFDKKARS